MDMFRSVNKISLTALCLVASIFFITPAQAKDKLKVVTTFTIIQDIAQNVAGDAAVVESITKPGAEIHDYQPTPKDIVKAQKADLILWNGLNLERWFERFFNELRNVRSLSLKVLPLCLFVKGLTKTTQTHMHGCRLIMH